MIITPASEHRRARANGAMAAGNREVSWSQGKDAGNRRLLLDSLFRLSRSLNYDAAPAWRSLLYLRRPSLAMMAR